jgi:4-diphosphocytidyl-2-C-methyl-D-erythritol kinase
MPFPVLVMILDISAVSMHNARMSDAHQEPFLRDTVCFVRAYAKINLTLDVLGRRADGYHSLSTVMQTIDLYDTLYLSVLDEDRVDLICTRPELSGAGNLAARAARLLRERYSIKQGILVELHKRIPVAAGLGGGSSDAAAVLLATQRLWHLPISFAELEELAAVLGSDVPFFLFGGLALCEGRGEVVTSLKPGWPQSMRWLLLLKPPIAISTASIFRRITARDYTGGSHSAAVAAALQSGQVPRAEDLHNGLERTVLELYPEVAQARADLLAAGGELVRLTGSGPTLYAPFPDLARATRAYEHLQAQGYEVYLSRPVASDRGSINSSFI